MKQFLTNSLAICGILAIGFFGISALSSDEEANGVAIKNNSEVKGMHDLPQTIKSISLLENPTFAGEAIPMNIDTRERLDRELSVNSYWHSSTLLNIKMANKYFPIMEPILAQHGVPDDFKYLAVAESNLRNVTSGAGAKGIWQFRKLAAKEWDLEVNGEVDERYHIEKATHAAAKYLKRLHKRFGNWANAAAAYNVGPTKFARTLKQQGETSFYDLNLNAETSRYVFRLAAIKQIMENPSGFGFYLNPSDYYERLDNVYNVEVTESVSSWSDFAHKNGITYRMLKYYNPWIIDGKLTVKNNTYLVKVPKR